MKKLALYKCFNPRTHTGCDPRTARDPSSPASFNPRTHTGCDHDPFSKEDEFYVSIHAPTRGATICIIQLRLILSGFNPRTHTGCDSGLSRTPQKSRVSIHAPTRGATAGSVRRIRKIIVSIHAPTRGATTPLLRYFPRGLFQSTHPHGVRLYRPQYPVAGYGFQSTHPHGVRLFHIEFDI